MTELGFSGEGKNGFYKYGLGLWSYSKKFDAIDTDFEPGDNNGWYLLLDHSFTKQFSTFLKYGAASQSVNQFSSAFEVGLNIKAPIESRPDDRLVFGFAQANTANDYARVNSTLMHESALEIAYNIDGGSGIKITPDYQYISNPGLVTGAKSIEVGSLRFELQF